MSSLLPIKPTLIEIRYEIEEQEAIQGITKKLNAEARQAQAQAYPASAGGPARDSVLNPSLATVKERLGLAKEKI